MVGYGREVERYLQPGLAFIGPEPKRRIRGLLEVSGVLEQLTPLVSRPATRAELARVHSDEYVQRIERESASGGGFAGGGTALSLGSFEIALLAAGGVIVAVDSVLNGSVDNAYALVRPPGHHATRDGGLGLCIFANVAIATRHLREARGLERVAVVDWDVHHGNGTQKLFYDDPSVLTVSLHQANVQMDDSTGGPEERGTGAGLGYNLNVPLPPGSGYGAYKDALERAVVPALRAFQPEFIIIACGFDACTDDPAGRMMLRPGAYREMMQMLLDAAAELCDGRLIAAHEGGYSEGTSPFCGLAAVSAMRGIRSELEDLADAQLYFGGDPDQELQPHQRAAIDAVLATQNTPVADVR